MTLNWVRIEIYRHNSEDTKHCSLKRGRKSNPSIIQLQFIRHFIRVLFIRSASLTPVFNVLGTTSGATDARSVVARLHIHQFVDFLSHLRLILLNICEPEQS